MLKICIALILMILLTGCMDMADGPGMVPPPAPASSPVPEPEPEQAQLSGPSHGGALRLSMRAPLTLNPLLNEDATVARVLQLMFEPLVILSEELLPVPHLATLEFAFNGASVVVTIREDAYWSNGSPITAYDLVFSIDTLRRAPENAIYSRNVENFAYHEILSERSARITFDTISGGAAYLFNFPIIPRHDFNDMTPISSGPFMFETYASMELLTLVRNPYTFRNRPYIEEVHVIITSDSETDRHAFDRGLVDIYLVDVPEWSRHRSVKPVRFAEYLTMHYEVIGFNFSRELPRKAYFRQAIAHALNIEEMITDIFLAHAVAASSPVHPASWLYDPEVVIYTYDINMAKFLADKAVGLASLDELWPVDAEGEKLPMEVLVNEGNVEGGRIASILVTQMNYIGLLAELVALPFEDYQWRLQEGHFDIFVGGYNLTPQPDLRFAFHSESHANILRYNDPEMDRILEAVAVAGMDSQFYRGMSEVQNHIAQELPVISLAFRHSAVIAGRRVQGDLRPGPDNIFINVHEWFISDLP